MSKRIVDVNGHITHQPKGYGEVLKVAYKMIDDMESEGVDRSDMSVVLSDMMFEIYFHLKFLPNRSKK